ncbi:MAG TPA: hypothetical protein VFW94_06255 [Candidatus Acidoferrales bacterium]|nr:hypothetical protein [Candidatus Acidoferrales bacterium]
MRKPLLSRGPLLAGVCLLSLAVLPGIGENSQPAAKRVPGIFDWTMRHAIYSRTGPMDKMMAAERDPRAMMIWQRQLGRWRWRRNSQGPATNSTHRDWSIYLGQNGTAPAMFPAEFNADASGAPDCVNDFVVFPIDATGSTAQPNIVAFNELYSGTAGGNGTCNRKASTSDTGTAAEVYWSYNVEGIPGGGAVTTSPAYSFDVNGTGTGKKIAFVESGSGNAHFHVLAWKAGDGKQASNFQSVGLGEISGIPTIANGGTGYARNDTVTVSGGSTAATYRVRRVGRQGRITGIVAQLALISSGFGYTTANGVGTTTNGGGTGLTLNITALSPTTITTFSATTPVVGSGTASDLAFGTSTDTRSSPFPDYGHDTVYVGNDAGQLYRIKDVFCMGTNGNPDCGSVSSGPAPSIDPSWGTGGFVQVCNGTLSSPDYDYFTGNVFVGCSDGALYAISQSGAVTSLQVGDGTTRGGIVDGPAADGVNGFVYAVSGSGAASGGASGVLVQAKTTDLSSNVMVPIGTGGQCDIHEPVPNNAYLTSITSAGALVYVEGVFGTVPGCAPTSNAGGFPPTMMIYGVTLSAKGTLTPGAPTFATPTTGTGSLAGGPGYEWAPATEFFNETTGHDWLFLGTLQDQGNVTSSDITTGFLGGGIITVRQEGMGVSGMVMDNDSPDAQASSFYFGAMGENATCNNTTLTTAKGGCAVKLTQAGLQ